MDGAAQLYKQINTLTMMVVFMSYPSLWNLRANPVPPYACQHTFSSCFTSATKSLQPHTDE